MNYSLINRSVISGNDLVGESAKKWDLYKYLLGNGVAYYYCKKLSFVRNDFEADIVRVGEEFNKKYIRTLRLIDKMCKRAKIKYLLFKTYKYVDEVVDGDVDIIVRGRDFAEFMRLFEGEGFDCEETEPLKGLCIKKGYCKLEPRVDISFYGSVYVDEEQMWVGKERVNVDGVSVWKVAKELDVLYFLLNVLYGPNYLKLYSYLLLVGLDLGSAVEYLKSEKTKGEVVRYYLKLVADVDYDVRFPVFVGNWDYLVFWVRSVRAVKALMFFFYCKYQYVLFGNLVFQHDWRLKYNLS